MNPDFRIAHLHFSEPDTYFPIVRSANGATVSMFRRDEHTVTGLVMIAR